MPSIFVGMHDSAGLLISYDKTGSSVKYCSSAFGSLIGMRSLSLAYLPLKYVTAHDAQFLSLLLMAQLVQHAFLISLVVINGINLCLLIDFIPMMQSKGLSKTNAVRRNEIGFCLLNKSFTLQLNVICLLTGLHTPENAVQTLVDVSSLN